MSRLDTGVARVKPVGLGVFARADGQGETGDLLGFFKPTFTRGIFTAELV